MKTPLGNFGRTKSKAKIQEERCPSGPPVAYNNFTNPISPYQHNHHQIQPLAHQNHFQHQQQQQIFSHANQFSQPSVPACAACQPQSIIHSQQPLQVYNTAIVMPHNHQVRGSNLESRPSEQNMMSNQIHAPVAQPAASNHHFSVLSSPYQNYNQIQSNPICPQQQQQQQQQASRFSENSYYSNQPLNHTSQPLTQHHQHHQQQQQHQLTSRFSENSYYSNQPLAHNNQQPQHQIQEQSQQYEGQKMRVQQQQQQPQTQQQQQQIAYQNTTMQHVESGLMEMRLNRQGPKIQDPSQYQNHMIKDKQTYGNDIGDLSSRSLKFMYDSEHEELIKLAKDLKNDLSKLANDLNDIRRDTPKYSVSEAKI